MVRLAQSYKPPVLLASRRVKFTIPMRGYIALTVSGNICEMRSIEQTLQPVSLTAYSGR